MRKSLLTILLPGLLVAGAARADAEVDWPRVDAVMNKEAAIVGAVHKYPLPRSDLHVTLDGVEIKPALALGGWIAFEQIGAQAVMMGDLVLTEVEAAPVLRSLLADGVGVTGLHNHLLRATPATLYMHVSGFGDPIVLARAVREALAETKTPFGASKASSNAASANLDADAVGAILGAKGKNNDGVWQFSIPRPDDVRVAGMAMPAAMGVATALNFEPTGDGKAAIAGDFVVLGKEVAPLLKTLQANGVEVTALHNHMLTDEPRLFFVHVFAHEDAVKLARALRAGLDVIGSEQSSIQPAPAPAHATSSK
jgi:hypothetical protein